MALNAMSRSGAIRWLDGGARCGDDVSFSRHASVIRVAEVLDEVVQVSVLTEMLNAGHIVWLALRRVREWEERLRFGGHVSPLGFGGSGEWILA